MGRIQHLRKFVCGSLAGLMLHTGGATAGGFQVTELCGNCQGFRNAGAAALATGPETVYFNPAGLTRLKGSEIHAGAQYITGQFKFQNKASTNAIGGTPVGQPNNDGAEDAAVANFYYSYELNDRATAGIGVNTPYGLKTHYSKGWIGRYNALKSDLKGVNINPGLGYEVSDWLSVGGGIALNYVDAELTSAVDLGTIGFLGGIPGFTPSTPQFDGDQRLDGDDWDVGWNAGVLFEPLEGTRIGLGYRSKIDHKVEGHTRLRVPASVSEGSGGAISSSKVRASVKVEIPQLAMVGVAQELGDRFTLLAGAWWTEWSAFDELVVKSSSSGETLQTEPQNWQDSWRFQLGMQYRHNPRWTFRAGVEYDESPVRKRDRTARIPDQNRKWVATGFTYAPLPNLSVDFSYSHIFLDDYSIHNTEVTTGEATGVPVGNTLVGEYKADADIFSTHLRWTF
jgi:long-chain fatty acid transport protein